MFSLPTGTEMFHFPAFPPHHLYIQRRVTRHHSCRVSPFGHPRITRSVDSSPRHIAASHVLHRLPVPRHPPCALKHLQHKTKKCSRHTMCRNCTSNNKHTTHTAESTAARCSQPLSTNQTPHPTTKARRQPRPIPGFPHSGRRDSGPVVSKPNSVSDNPSPAPITEPRTGSTFVVAPRTTPTTGAAHPRIAQDTEPPHDCGRAQVSWCSLERR